MATGAKFCEIFEKEWVQLAGIPLDQKLKKLKAPLRKWNKEVFGHIDMKIQAFKKELVKIDEQAQERELEEIEWHRRNALQT